MTDNITHAVQFTMRSTNVKTGPIPVSTTTSNTCPDKCALKSSGCYAKGGNVGMLWRALDKATPGEKFKSGIATLQSLTWLAFTDRVRALPEDQLWRHNQAGDLPGEGDVIDTGAMRALVLANSGRRGFTYTHKPLDHAHNAAMVRFANANGFTVNLSANNLREADQLVDANVGPVVVVLPAEVHGNVKITTSAGRKVVVCPATYREDVTCASCGLCQRQERKVIVGFPAHGASKRKASAIATQN